MRTFKPRTHKKKFSFNPEQEQQYRSRLVVRIREAHGYSDAYLSGQTTQHLTQLARRIGHESGLRKMQALPVNRHAAKLTA